MKIQYEKFDMCKKPTKHKFYLKPIERLLCLGDFKKKAPIIHYSRTEHIEGPFLLLCNHNAFFDFKVCNTLLDRDHHEGNSVVAIDGFLNRQWLLRSVGCICKRKFTNDIVLIKQLRHVIKMGNVAVVYPEARYSLCGTTSVLPSSIGKLAKVLGVPLVTLVCHGHHVNSPFWDSSHDRGVIHPEAYYTMLFDKDELAKATVDEINDKIVEAFQYDDFAWQKKNNVIINEPNRADGLHRVLYQCPHCLKEYRMNSKGSKVYCEECGTEYELTELGELKCLNNKTKFDKVTDWYEWERANVRKEIENGTYSTGTLKVRVDTLPKDRFYFLGNGTLTHDMNGFKVEGIDVDGDKFEMIKPVDSLYSCHIEYRYLFKYGDCIDLNTLEDTWYIYPEGKDFSVTKIALATEELFFYNQRKQGKENKKGLA